MESVVYNDASGKRVGSLEQIRKGLKLMDVLDLQSANHEILQPLFVYSESDITLARFLEKIEFEKRNETTCSFFIHYLQKAGPQKLEKILMYLIGCRFLPLGKIKVKFIDGDGFANSTCLLELQLPTGSLSSILRNILMLLLAVRNFPAFKFLYYLK